jgi:anhydro-N-acetylmuramic acid kinase
LTTCKDMLQELKRKSSRTIIGLMSGTSVDGITSALTKIAGTGENVKINLISYRTYPYPNEVRIRLFKLFEPGVATVREVCEMNFVVGECFAKAAQRLINDSDIDAAEVDLVGSHGQTLWHQPVTESVAGISAVSTLQIGEPAVISSQTGLPVVADFRKADIAVGGQGAPLTPYLDYVLHKHQSKSIVLQNIGGIANLTYIPASAAPKQVVAFDTGPGNMIIDAVAKHYTYVDYDEDGSLARSGKVHTGLLSELMKHPYYHRRPPKTTGREVFGEHYASKVIKRGESIDLSPEDITATATALTVESIVEAYKNILPGPVDEVYVSGGGSKNQTIMKWLKARLKVPVDDYSTLGYPGEAKESLLMALLANEYIMGTPCNMPSATGAKKRAVLGNLTKI